MSWKYDGLNPWALHVESQRRFGIRYEKTPTQAADLTLIPPEGAAGQWSAVDLEQLKVSLWGEMQRVWEQNALRNRLQSLIRSKLGGDNFRAASVISSLTGKVVSARSIQAWLIEPAKRSSRTCPEWAVKALESYSPPASVDAAQSAQPLSAFEIAMKHGVARAEHGIEADERLRQAWVDTPLSALPGRLYEMECRLNEHLDYLSETLHSVRTALKSSKDFDEFKQATTEKLEAAGYLRFSVRQTRRDIEQGSDEFSNAEGLPTQKGA